MKKFLSLTIIMLLFLTSKAQAQSIKVSAIDDFSSEQSSSVFKVKTIEYNQIQGMFFEPGTIISGMVLKVHEPARGKRDGYFEFIPTNIGDTKINSPKTIGKITYYKPVDPPKAALNIAGKIANIFLKGLITGAEFAQGAIEAPNGQRIKSGAKKAYNDSFLSYIEVGQELNIKPGDILILKLKKVR